MTGDIMRGPMAPYLTCNCSMEVCRREGCVLQRQLPSGNYMGGFGQPAPANPFDGLPNGWLQQQQQPKPRIRVKAGREVIT